MDGMEGVVTPAQLGEVETSLAAVVSGLRVDLVAPREAPPLIETLTRLERLAAGARLLLARLVDESSAPADAGLRNGAEWIAKTTGTSPSAGHEVVAASRRLENLHTTAAAVARGELSVDQARVIAAAAAADPEAEARLVDMAVRVSLKELRDECDRVRAAADPDPEATRERLHRERRLRIFRDAAGFFALSGRGTPDSGAEMKVVLDALIDEIFHEAHAEGRRETRDAYGWDALVEMARRAWAHMHDLEPEADTEAAPGAAVQVPRKKRRKNGVNPRFQATLLLSYEAMTRGWAVGDEVCEIPGIGPISVPGALRLLSESVLELLVTKGEDVHTRTHVGRGLDAAQKVAARALYPECARAGCHRPAAEWDHRDPYATVRVTNLRNIDGLCHHCHHLKTHDGWALLPGTGKREMVPPTDSRHPGNPTFHRRKRKPAA